MRIFPLAALAALIATTVVWELKPTETVSVPVPYLVEVPVYIPQPVKVVRAKPPKPVTDPALVCIVFCIRLPNS